MMVVFGLEMKAPPKGEVIFHIVDNGSRDPVHTSLYNRFVPIGAYMCLYVLMLYVQFYHVEINVGMLQTSECCHDTVLLSTLSATSVYTFPRCLTRRVFDSNSLVDGSSELSFHLDKFDDLHDNEQDCEISLHGNCIRVDRF